MSSVLETIERMVHGGVGFMSEEKVLMAIEGVGVLCGNPAHGDIRPPMEERVAGINDENEGGDVYMAIYECNFCGNECCVILKVVE
jgi:hypothetical protein